MYRTIRRRTCERKTVYFQNFILRFVLLFSICRFCISLYFVYLQCEIKRYRCLWKNRKALLEEIEILRHDKAMLINRVASLEQSLYWLRKKVLGRINEKSFPLGPNQLLLFLKEEMSSMEIFRIEEEVRKNEEEITKNIKVKEKLVHNSLGISSLLVEVINLYPEVTTDAEAG